jgi:23S rRNA pseudouridine1911/1915/1917 synthase
MKKSFFSVIYEDNHILVVSKPAGLLTQPTDLNGESLETAVKAWLKEKYNKPGNVFLGVIHRIDKPVSGIVILAKTSKALSRLNEAMRAKESQKIYRALVEQRPPNDEDTLEHYLRHDNYRASVSNAQDKQAKKARLHYRVIERFPSACLVEINLETGRYHQIRAQFAAIGCPVIGDNKYGSCYPMQEGIIALHHLRLQITHPVTRELMSFESPLPEYF